MGMVVGYRSAADADSAAASNSRCDVLRRTRDKERLWPPGPTSIPQETGMNRRVSPCGLRGGIGGHQGASWTPIGGRRASVMRCPVSQRWTSGRMSQMRLHPVSQACGLDLRPASSGCMWLCLDRLLPPRPRGACTRVAFGPHFPGGVLRFAAGCCRLASLVSHAKPHVPAQGRPRVLGPPSPRLACGQTLPFVFVIT